MQTGLEQFVDGSGAGQDEVEVEEVGADTDEISHDCLASRRFGSVELSHKDPDQIETKGPSKDQSKG